MRSQIHLLRVTPCHSSPPSHLSLLRQKGIGGVAAGFALGRGDPVFALLAALLLISHPHSQSAQWERRGCLKNKAPRPFAGHLQPLLGLQHRGAGREQGCGTRTGTARR